MDKCTENFLDRGRYGMFHSSSAVSQDHIKDETLKDDLKFYLMNPCEKYRARRHIPWKMGVQILKIVMITTQVCDQPTELFHCDHT